LGAEWGYDEINLNVGCPSDRVQNGRFGACLMAEPGLVAECVAAMAAAVEIPVTVKHRIGIDNLDSYEALARFVGTVAGAGCSTFIVHARKAWLQGLSPKENREIPPLRYDLVYALKRDFPALEIVLNGGIASLDDAALHLEQVDGVMVGRAAYHDPWLLAEVDRRFYHDSHERPTPHAVVEEYLPYVEHQLRAGVPLTRMTRHLLGLFAGRPGARRWRRVLSEGAHRPGAGPGLILAALREVPPETGREPLSA
jgi:tRNA-dihydrouridine synthase A